MLLACAVLAVVPYWTWVVAAAATAAAAVICLAAALASTRLRAHLRVGVRLAVLACAIGIQPFGVRAVWNARLPLQARRVDAASYHVAWVDGWIPSWLRLHLVVLRDIGNGERSWELFTASAVGGVLFWNADDAVACSYRCPLLAARDTLRRPETAEAFALLRAGGSYWVVQPGERGGERLVFGVVEPATLWYWLIVGLLGIGATAAKRRTARNGRGT